MKKKWFAIVGLNKYAVLLSFRERQQLGFVTVNGYLAVNLKTTQSTHPLFNGRGQFTFLKKKFSHSSGIIVYSPKFEFECDI